MQQTSTMMRQTATTMKQTPTMMQQPIDGNQKKYKLKLGEQEFNTKTSFNRQDRFGNADVDRDLNHSNTVPQNYSKDSGFLDLTRHQSQSIFESDVTLGSFDLGQAHMQGLSNADSGFMNSQHAMQSNYEKNQTYSTQKQTKEMESTLHNFTPFPPNRLPMDKAFAPTKFRVEYFVIVLQRVNWECQFKKHCKIKNYDFFS